MKRARTDYIYTRKTISERKEGKWYTNRYPRFLIFPIKLKIINLYNLDPNIRWYLTKYTGKVLLKEKKAEDLISEINKSLLEINNCGWTWKYLGIILVPKKNSTSNQFKRVNIDFLLNRDLQYIYYLNKGTTKIKDLIIYKNLLNINPKKELPKVINNLLNLSYLPDNSKAIMNYIKEGLLMLFISRINGWV